MQIKLLKVRHYFRLTLKEQIKPVVLNLLSNKSSFEQGIRWNMLYRITLFFKDQVMLVLPFKKLLRHTLIILIKTAME